MAEIEDDDSEIIDLPVGDYVFTMIEKDDDEEISMTLNLIDSLSTIANVLAKRDLSSESVVAGLKSLRKEKDLKLVMGTKSSYGFVG